MEVLINNDAKDINARTALGVVMIDPATGAAVTGSGGNGGSDTLPPNAAEESGGNLDAIRAALAGTLPAGCTVTFDVPAGDTLGAIAFDATGTTLMISTLT